MNKQRVCFDACIFIARKCQDWPPEILTSIQSLLERVERGEIFAVVSTLIYSELLDNTQEKLEAMLDTRKGTSYDVEPPIANLARKVRKKIQGPGDSAKLEVPDCIYIATAIIYKCDYLVTLDGLVYKDGILKLSGKHRMLSAAQKIQSEFGLKVCQPLDVVNQHVMLYDLPDHSN